MTTAKSSPATCRRLRRNCRRGSIVVLTAFVLVALLAAVAFSVDVAYMQLVRSELRAVTDLAARAGTESIMRTRDEAQARQAAQAIAAANRVAGVALNLRDTDIVFGRVAETNGRSVFTPGQRPFNTCQVAGQRTAQSATGAVSLFFGPVFGVRHFEPAFTSIVTRQIPKRDISVVVDRSGSMNEFVSPGTKWDGLLTAFDGLLTTLAQTPDDEQLGLSSYSSSSTIDATMTNNYADVRTALHGHNPGGFTNITSGVLNGLTVMNGSRNDPDVQKLMIVMTDGLHNTGPSPLTLVNQVNQAGVILITITFGHDADQFGMRQLANATNGRHFHAATTRDLERLFEEIGAGTEGLQYFK